MSVDCAGHVSVPIHDPDSGAHLGSVETHWDGSAVTGVETCPPMPQQEQAWFTHHFKRLIREARTHG